MAEQTAQTAPFGPVSDHKPDKIGNPTTVGVHDPKFTDGTANLGATVKVNRAGK